MRKLEVPQAGLARILPLAGADDHEVLSLNNANSVETSWLTERALGSLVAMACHATRIDEPGGMGALLIALDQDAPYDNPNFSWFKDRHRSFVYIDRVVTAQASRGRGHGRRLYENLFAWARDAGHGVVGCEVNIDPPNPGSDAFHKALGFREVGYAAIRGGEKVVRYMEAEL